MGSQADQPTLLDPCPMRSRGGVKQGARTERSVSRKRQRNGSGGEWQEPARPRGARKKKEGMPTSRGTASLDDFPDLEGSVEVYIGNVNPHLTKDRIVEFLERNATQRGVEDFKVEEIVPLTKVENPRSRS